MSSPVPNNELTRFKTGAEQVEIARKGGIASGEAKRKKKTFINAIKWLANADCDFKTGKIKETFEQNGIDITGLDKAEVLHALYQRAHYKGLGLYSAVIKYSVKDARRDYEASESKYFDYLYGRVLKVDLSGDSFDSWLYDRDNGIHAAEEAINKLRGKT
jgi:hypothetical protein